MGSHRISNQLMDVVGTFNLLDNGATAMVSLPLITVPVFLLLTDSSTALALLLVSLMGSSGQANSRPAMFQSISKRGFSVIMSTFVGRFLLWLRGYRSLTGVTLRRGRRGLGCTRGSLIRDGRTLRRGGPIENASSSISIPVTVGTMLDTIIVFKDNTLVLGPVIFSA